jgi:hypothetical protein
MDNKPDFLIIGAQRCGTTSLFYYLSQHPDLSMPETKEIHYFDTQYENGTEWYSDFFKKAPREKEKLTGEASPYYIFHPLCPERIACHLPDVKLIALLRNPIDRAYSHFIHQRKLNTEPIGSFEEAIAIEEIRIAGEDEKLILGIKNISVPHRRYSYVNRGFYFNQISRWLRYFPMNQMLFVKSEDLFQNPVPALKEIHDFLNIRGILPHCLEPKNKNNYPKISDITRNHLSGIFAEESRKLKNLLGDRFVWY